MNKPSYLLMAAPQIRQEKKPACRIISQYVYRKFSNRGATPYRGAPSFLAPILLGFWTFLPISQSKMVRFISVKNGPICNL